MDILVYKIVHLVGLILLFQSLGASTFSRMLPGETDGKSGKMLTIMHGIGLFLLLLGGFGMLARLEIGFPFPVWTWVKLIIWIVLGAAPILVKKRTETARTWWTVILLLGVVAAYMGLYKPF